jgi:hypothetical protein
VGAETASSPSPTSFSTGVENHGVHAGPRRRCADRAWSVGPRRSRRSCFSSVSIALLWPGEETTDLTTARSGQSRIPLALIRRPQSVATQALAFLSDRAGNDGRVAHADRDERVP